jgi:hypothetical protein
MDSYNPLQRDPKGLKINKRVLQVEVYIKGERDL